MTTFSSEGNGCKPFNNLVYVCQMQTTIKSGKALGKIQNIIKVIKDFEWQGKTQY